METARRRQLLEKQARRSLLPGPSLSASREAYSGREDANQFVSGAAAFAPTAACSSGLSAPFLHRAFPQPAVTAGQAGTTAVLPGFAAGCNVAPCGLSHLSSFMPCSALGPGPSLYYASGAAPCVPSSYAPQLLHPAQAMVGALQPPFGLVACPWHPVTAPVLAPQIAEQSRGACGHADGQREYGSVQTGDPGTCAPDDMVKAPPPSSETHPDTHAASASVAKPSRFAAGNRLSGYSTSKLAAPNRHTPEKPLMKRVVCRFPCTAVCSCFVDYHSSPITVG